MLRAPTGLGPRVDHNDPRPFHPKRNRATSSTCSMTDLSRRTLSGKVPGPSKE